MSASVPPTSTYRLQLTGDFDLDDAAALVDYLDALGVGWLYLSPLLRAEPGSQHGYDVVDHHVVDPARGGASGLEHLAATAHAAGLGVLADIVPNHMGVATPRRNSWWWDVLRLGPGSPHAESFDIDWDAGDGRIRIPILGDDGVDALTLDGDELAYHEHRFPLAPGSGTGSATEVHDRQHYELVDWRQADHSLNYRRFFAVNSLAGIRVERPAVFDESHQEVLRWIREGLVDGLRIDHPDGLADPGGYLERLAEATGRAPVWVEKILESGERLPATWAVLGTTGYEALADLDRVLVDPSGEAPLRALLPARDWAESVHDSKRFVADGILGSEVRRLARLLPAGLGDDDRAADAIAELLACFPVYRSYLPLGTEYLAAAHETAARHRPDLAETLDALVVVLADETAPAAVRFQQTSGMVMAKGVEDTVFYRFVALSSLCEVGADPSEFAIDLNEFHRRQIERQAMDPATLTARSTHDTKRGEDTRARIAELAEHADEWAPIFAALRETHGTGDAEFDAVLFQAALGAWPISRERLAGYAEKAAREAGVSTSWTEPDEDFETRMHAAVDALFDDPDAARLLSRAVDLVAADGWDSALSAKLLQLAAPGVPDVYQGSELWETSLVDPDNRRPVDFGERRALLARLDAGWRPPIGSDGAAKLLVTSRVLRARRLSDLFTRYAPVTATGSAADHLVAFDRGGAIAAATRLPRRLRESGGWGDTELIAADHDTVDVLTGRRFERGALRVAELLADYPCALLLPADRAGEVLR